MPNRIISFIAVLMSLVVWLVIYANAQEPTPFSPIIPQGNPNIGQVQPFALSDVTVRTGIAPWLEAGWTGAGVRVGVLDRGFGGILAFEEMFGVDITTATGATDADYDANPITHGTQVLEVLHRTAPGAELYTCEYDTLDTFNLCIDYMINVGVRVINHSAGVPALPLDGTNPWALQVDRAAQQDILWVQSAGNFAQGYYRDFLVYSDPINPVHEFRGRTGIESALAVNPVSATANGVVMLSWEDHNEREANTYDLDLYIFDPETGEPIGGSSRTQAGMPGDEALEYDRISMNRPFAIQIRDNTGEAFGIPFALYVEFANVPSGAADRSIIAPGDSANALTVGALQGFRVAPYSSRGPIGDGIVKPDITAPGEVRLNNGTQFIGTSAAAPIIAGGAALLLERDPDMRALLLRDELLSAVQDDDQFPGVDNNYGNGRFFLPTAPGTSQSIQATSVPTEVAMAEVIGLSLVNPVTLNSQWSPVEETFNNIPMVQVPAGCINLGSTPEQSQSAYDLCVATAGVSACQGIPFQREQPTSNFCVETPFWIDKYEVSTTAYNSLSTFSETDTAHVSVTWEEANQHCRLREARLPTEAEWEYAARGPNASIFPWGDQFDVTKLTYRENASQPTSVNANPEGASWVGAYNLSGNVWEWTNSEFRDYPYNQNDGRELNSGGLRVIRGGGWTDGASIVRPAYRGRNLFNAQDSATGFRCARDD